MNYNYTRRPDLVDFIPDTYSKVIEIGCGDASFKHNLKKNIEYWCVECSEEAIKNIDPSVKIIKGKYEEKISSLPDNYFDLIICNDVIEHINDHNLFFKSIKRIMKNNSFLLGSVPNVRYYTNFYHYILKKDWKYVDEGILDYTHLRFFTEKSMLRTIYKNQFTIIKFKKINKLENNNFRHLFHLIILFFMDILFLGFFDDLKFMRFGFLLKIHK